jgi:preprotein translocase SecE subunit
MARDRKRAKQRQRRRAGQQRSQRQDRQGSARARVETPAPDTTAPDAGEGEIVQRAHEEDPTAAPDPLAHASADVDMAELAEASVQEPAPDGPLEEDEYPQPDELEGADVLERAEEDEEEAAARPARRTAPGAALPKEGNRFANFLRACVAELRRVQWPDRRAVGQATAVVLVFVLIAGGYLGVLDAIFSRLVNLIL